MDSRDRARIVALGSYWRELAKQARELAERDGSEAALRICDIQATVLEQCADDLTNRVYPRPRAL